MLPILLSEAGLLSPKEPNSPQVFEARGNDLTNKSYPSLCMDRSDFVPAHLQLGVQLDGYKLFLSPRVSYATKPLAADDSFAVYTFGAQYENL